MSESGMRGLLLGHGDMAAGMADAVRQITGAGEEALVPLSNRGRSPESLAELVRAHAGSEPVVLFTDLQSGSCGFVARRMAQQGAPMVVISGVNLPMLLEFVMNRHLPMEQLVPRLMAKGRAAMGCVPAELEKHEHRAVSG